MNKKVIFTIAPMALVMGALTGCKGGDTPTPTPEKTLTKIEVTPTMKTYTVGYEFTKDDIGSFQAYYSDGSTTPIKEGYTSDPNLPYTFKDEDVDKGKDFNFTYQGKSASFHVDVVKTKTLDSISATCSKAFKVNDTLNKDDIAVTAKYSDQTTEKITDWTCSNVTFPYTFKEEDAGKELTLKISYKDKQTEVKVTCADDTVKSLSAKLESTSKKFYVGQQITKKDFEVTAEYESGKTETVEFDKWTSKVEFPYTFVDEDIANGKVFDITYGGKDTSVTVKPLEDSLEKIEASVDKSFNVGETIGKDDITVIATYLSEKTETIASDKWTSTVTFPYTFVKDDATSGKSFDISYDGKDTTVTVSPTYVAVTSITCKQDFVAFGYWDEGFGDYSPSEFDIKVLPENASIKGFTIESSNEEVCYYDEEDDEIKFTYNGGACTLTVKSKDNPSITATCSVKANKLSIDPGQVEEFPVGGTQQLTFSATYDEYLDYSKAYWTIESDDDDLTLTQDESDVKKATIKRNSGGSGDGDAYFHVPNKDGTMNFEITCYIDGEDTPEPEPELSIEVDGDPEDMYPGDELSFTLKDENGQVIKSGYEVYYYPEGVVEVDTTRNVIKAKMDGDGYCDVEFSYNDVICELTCYVNGEEPEPDFRVDPEDMSLKYNETGTIKAYYQDEEVTDDCTFTIQQGNEYIQLNGNVVKCVTEEEDAFATICVSYEDEDITVYVWCNET